MFSEQDIPYHKGVLHRRGKRGGGGVRGAGGQPPDNLRGGPTIAPPPPNNPPTFSFNFYVKHEKNHKCIKLKGEIIINVTLI